MSQSVNQIRERTFLAILLTCAFFVTLCEAVIIWICPEKFLLERIFADDYFYYLQLAKNASNGLGASFDGESQTNGFHPLYFLCLSAWTKVTGLTGWAFARTGIVIPLLAHNLCGVIVARVLFRSGQSSWGMLAASTWWLSPFALQITGLGLEAPLATFFILLLVLSLSENRNSTISTAFFNGLIVGLAILARTDSVLLIPVFGLWILIRTGRGELLRSTVRLGAVVLGVLIVTGPWWWWSTSQFGTILQSSGVATRLHSKLSGNGFMADVLRSMASYWFKVIVGFACVLIGVKFTLRKSGETNSADCNPRSKDLVFVLLFLALVCGYYTIYARHVQGWYVHSTLCVLIALGFIRLAGSWHCPPIFPTLLSISALSLVGFLSIESQRPPSLQLGGYLIASWVNSATEETDVVGSWNSGVVGFFSNRPVVNLDGVVNNDVVRIMQRPDYRGLVSLAGYLRQRRISILADYEPILPVDLSGIGFSGHEVSEVPYLRVFRRVPE